MARRLNLHPTFALTNRGSDEIIAFNAGGPVTVGQLLSEATALSRHLPVNAYVINLFADRYHFLVGFCAATMAGQCTLMPANRLAQTLEHLSVDFPDSYSIGGAGPNLHPLAIEEICAAVDQSKATKAPVIPARQLCAITFTSGSTGKPTPNHKYWETLRTGALNNAELLNVNLPERLNLVATVPMQHMWGFETSVILPLFSNVAASSGMPFFPQDIANALESLPRPRALVSSPVHLNALLNSGVGLPEVDHIFSATAPMSEEQAKALQNQYKTRVLEIFGCSEAGIVAVRNTASETLWRVSDAFQLVVRDNETLVRGQHLPGEVVLQDVIELTGENRFRWLGRQSDMINVAGKRGSLEDLNRRLCAIPGVQDAVIFMPGYGPERLVALVVAPGLSPADVLSALKTQIEPVFLPRPVFLVSELPRQDTGKLAMSAVLELFEQQKSKREHANVQSNIHPQRTPNE